MLYQLQDILNCVENWCNKWRLKVNADKTNFMQFRGKRTTCTTFNFKFDHNEPKIVDQYKYLGVILQENLDYNVTTSVLAGAAGRALGADISKFKSFRNVGYNAFSNMYESHVVPVIDYSAGVWGY